MKILLANYDLKKFHYKKGFACNKGLKKFMYIENEMNLRFSEPMVSELDIPKPLTNAFRKKTFL